MQVEHVGDEVQEEHVEHGSDDDEHNPVLNMASVDDSVSAKIEG